MIKTLFFYQYAAETKSAGLLSAQEDLLKDENSAWRMWYTEDYGPALPPCSNSFCSAFEKLVIVQLYAVLLIHGCVRVLLSRPGCAPTDLQQRLLHLWSQLMQA
jgi:hypothetical protein